MLSKKQTQNLGIVAIIKKAIFVFVLSLGLYSCSPEGPPTYELSGKLTNVSQEKIVLLALTGNYPKAIDTAITDEKGNFKFQFVANYPMEIFVANETGEWYIDLIAEPNDMTLNAELNEANKKLENIKVTGSKNQKLKEQFLEEVSPILKEINAITEMLSKSGELDEESQTKHQELLEKYIDISKKMIVEKPASYFSFVTLMQSLIETIQDKEELAIIYKKFTDKFTYSYHYQKFLFFKENYDKLAKIGQLPDYEFYNLKDEKYKLSEILGKKYTMVDFWATWCKPCLIEMPELAKVYREFKAQGVELVSVNVDEKISAWKDRSTDYIKDWTNLSQKTGFQSEPLKLLGVNGIPYIIILDGNRNIVAQYKGAGSSTQIRQFLNKNL